MRPHKIFFFIILIYAIVWLTAPKASAMTTFYGDQTGYGMTILYEVIFYGK